jgi:hypothetical protein
MEGVYSVVADVVVLYSPYPPPNYGFTLKYAVLRPVR